MIFNKETRILVVAAHPDDEVLGCGGTIIQAVRAGAHVSVMFLGEGISARFQYGQYDSEEFKDQTIIRENGAKRALEFMGVSQQYFGRHYCCQFDSIPLIQFVKEIERIIENVRPDLLFTHNISEVNQDHRIAFYAVEAACRPTRAVSPREIYTFEIVCSGAWTFETAFKPNVYVDISNVWNDKMKALRFYEGEVGEFPSPRSEEGLLTLAKYRGMAVGVQMAEAFKLVRKVIPLNP